MKKMIEASGLTKKYGEQLAVNKVDITVYEGDIYGLVGKNGAGKSTLFKMLMGITNPNSGSIKLMGESGEAGLTNARLKTGFMISTSFFPYLNAYDNLDYFRKVKGLSDKSEIQRILTLVGLDGVKKPYRAYSLGMKQRLAIGNALLGSPKLVILDEPVNGLDPQGIVEFRNLILSLNREHGITFLVSSHILGELGLMANRFGFIDHGVLIQELDGKELQQHAKKDIIVKTIDLKETYEVLANELHYTNMEIVSEELHIRDEGAVINDVAKVLVENNIAIYGIDSLKATVEDYFLELTGGIQ